MPVTCEIPATTHKVVGWWPQSIDPLKAGVRMRCLTPLAALQRDGVEVELYDPACEARYCSVIVQAWSVFGTVRNSLPPDAMLVAVARLKQQGVRIVVDNCDNQFYNPTNNPDWEAQVNRLRKLLAMADHLVCATEALAQVTREQGFEQPVSVVGDAVEGDADLMPGESWARRHLNPRRWPAKRKLLQHARWVGYWRDRGHLPLVWFGNHGVGFAEGGMGDLAAVRDQIHRVSERCPVSLSVISNHPPKYQALFRDWSIPHHYLDWDRTTFLEALRLHDVALIPVADNPFTRCKSGNRVATALHEGLSVVADAISSYKVFSEFGFLNGFDGAVADYLLDAEGRKERAAAGRAFVARKCSQAAVALQWRQVINAELLRASGRATSAAGVDSRATSLRA
ncbi:hypothetical protein [Niveibacterium umoris]|uniref:Glycosyltransferase family 1 protein n=2 Tax=Niveibacterium umoris TaxID=1193620 RepID=A0A840BKX0_9RHOO|nr:hypothetical protein [Niveibacterium umoris]MBB4012272.1 hypothetical protein [Niveibacterium umoris]